jgi:hypothetical protein
VTSAIGHEPIHPDRFERELVIGWNDDATLVIGACTSTYPGRRIADASVTVVADGRLRSLHRSQRLGDHRLPWAVDEPALGWRAVLDVSTADPGTNAMPRTSVDGGVPGHHSTSVVASGTLDAQVTIDDRSAAASLPALVLRTSGVEPIDPTPPGAPSHHLPQELWWTAVVDHDGATLIAGGAEDEHGHCRDRIGTHALRPTWQPGSRRLSSATLVDDRDAVTLTPLVRVDMAGLGFTSATWPHGRWHDETAIGTEDWAVERVPTGDVYDVHHGYIVSTGDGRAAGWLEVLAVGPHEPSGLVGFTDGFRPDA